MQRNIRVMGDHVETWETQVEGTSPNGTNLAR